MRSSGHAFHVLKRAVLANRQSGYLQKCIFPPVHFNDIIVFRQVPAITKAGIDRHLIGLMQPGQGRQIHMIIMVMAEQYGINMRQLIQAMPAGMTRCGPRDAEGLAYSHQTGSVRKLYGPIWIRAVACPINQICQSSKVASGRFCGKARGREKLGTFLFQIYFPSSGFSGE